MCVFTVNRNIVTLSHAQDQIMDTLTHSVIAVSASVQQVGQGGSAEREADKYIHLTFI